MTRLIRYSLVFALGHCLVTASHAQEIGEVAVPAFVGVNVVNPLRASLKSQDSLLNQLHGAHVKVIRCGLGDLAQGIDFAKRAGLKGISILLVTNAKFQAGAPSRTYQPATFPQMWGGPGLSSADEKRSGDYFEVLFKRLDSAGISLTAVELGNEINGAAFNPDFPLPGEGRILGLNDLFNDPEGIVVAKGFRQYLKVLAILRTVMKHSRLNAKTPLLSAGLVSEKFGDRLYNTKKEDFVSSHATILYLQKFGLDSLVDGYGVHTYLSGEKPGNAVEDQKRSSRFFEVDIQDCRPPGSKTGKPGWITEWGFQNKDFNCPPKNAGPVQLVKSMISTFAKAVGARRIMGLFYYSWNADPWSAGTPSPWSVYRCSSLSEAGREALRPVR